MKIRATLLLLFIVILLTSCQKDTATKEDKIPPFTEKGENTFACKVNGKIWLAQCKNCFGGEDLMAGYGKGNLAIHANKIIDGIKDDIDIDAQNIKGPGEYTLGHNAGNTAKLIRYYPLPEKIFRTTEQHGGKLIIKKLDTINRICTGTFYFDVIETNGDAILHITEGQFDFTWPK